MLFKRDLCWTEQKKHKTITIGHRNSEEESIKEKNKDDKKPQNKKKSTNEKEESFQASRIKTLSKIESAFQVSKPLYGHRCKSAAS